MSDKLDSEPLSPVPLLWPLVEAIKDDDEADTTELRPPSRVSSVVGRMLTLMLELDACSVWGADKELTVWTLEDKAVRALVELAIGLFKSNDDGVVVADSCCDKIDCSMGTGREDPPELFNRLLVGGGVGLDVLQEVVSETEADLLVALVFNRPARNDWFPLFPIKDSSPSFSSLLAGALLWWPSRISHNPLTSRSLAVWRSCGIFSCSTITCPWYMKYKMADSSEYPTSRRMMMGCWHGLSWWKKAIFESDVDKLEKKWIKNISYRYF